MCAGLLQLVGVSLLWGISFTMSPFVSLLAFADDPLVQEEVNVGILVGSTLSGLAGWTLLRFAPRRYRPEI